jgi:hypothetical protein
MPEAYIHQIYYNTQTRDALDPGFIPLDNTSNERPDWYELWVIRRYLTTHALEENAWYGFLSPKFGLKTGLSSNQLNRLIHQINPRCDVILVNYSFDQIAYFLNPFESGEYWYPGITELSQKIFDQLNYNVNINNLVTHSYNFTFCNYIIAKPRYWRSWLEMANRLFDYIEHSDSEIATSTRAMTVMYGSPKHCAPMKTFIQERIPCIIGTMEKFNFITIENLTSFVIFDRIFLEDRYTRAILQTCNALKLRYTESHDTDCLKAFYSARRLISIKQRSKIIL